MIGPVRDFRDAALLPDTVDEVTRRILAFAQVHPPAKERP